MSDAVTKYFAAEDALYRAFGCDEKYPLRVAQLCKWQIKRDVSTYFLALMEDTNKATEFVVVQKDGKPLIYNADGYSMIIAIDCVKMAFILDDGKVMD